MPTILANAFGRWLFEQLWQMSLELAVLSAAVAGAIAILRPRSAALRHLFWCLLLAKPLATFLVASPISLYWFLNPQTEATLPARPISFDARPPSMPIYTAPKPGHPRPVTPPGIYEGEPEFPLDRFGWLACLWVLGAVGLSARIGFGFFYVAYLRRTAIPAMDGPLGHLLATTAEKMGLRTRATIAISEADTGPILAGTLSPVILIPADLATSLSERQLQSVLAHELAHAHRRDNLVLLAQRLTEMLLFFHPVVWLAGRMLRREAEAASDNIALRHFGNAHAYADSLTRVAELRIGLGQRLLVNTFAATETEFARRVRSILAYPARSTSLRLTLISALALVFISALGLPRVAGESEKEPEEDAKIAASEKDAVASSSSNGGGMNSDPGTRNERNILTGVRKVAFHTDRYRFTPFCNAFDACIQYLGQPEQYDRVMAISGAAFRMRWQAKAWDGGNSDIMGMTSHTLEPMHRAFQAVGYQMIPVVKEQTSNWAEDLLARSAPDYDGIQTDESGFRRHILESIDAGRPVIAFGVIGPPEACVITGYDQGGDVLIGWSMFQQDAVIDTEPDGQFRVADWFPPTRGLLLFGDPIDPPAQVDLHRASLLWAIEILRTPLVDGGEAGPLAFDAWAADMADDAFFPADQENVLRGRLGSHYDAMTMQADRGTAAPFFLEVAEANPSMAEPLQEAAQITKNLGVLHGVKPNERDQIARLADHEVRSRISESILVARDRDQRVADLLEQALVASGVPADQIPRPVAAPSEAPSDPSDSVILEGVPKVGFGMIDGHVGMTPLAACLRACLEYMEDDLDFGRDPTTDAFPRDAVYAYLMGTTGAAFRLSWKDGWHGDNVASWLVSDDPAEIFSRAFDAIGYNQIVSGHPPKDRKQEVFRELVITSIRDRRRPVIAHGVIGPPEEAIIAGFGEGGRVVYGWSFFQDDTIGKPGVEFMPNGYYRKREWESDTWSMMAIGGKTGTPDRKAAYVDALKWALEVIREPERYKGERHNGLAAYDAWADHILRDDDVARNPGPDETFGVHSDAIDVVAEGRHYASVFLRQVADTFPEAHDDLISAAERCRAQHDLMWGIWNLVGGNQRGPEQKKAFQDPAIRRQIAAVIHRARDKQEEAAERIESALHTLGISVPEMREESSAPPSSSTEPTNQSGHTKKMLEGLRSKKLYTPQVACMIAGAEYLGVEASTPWIFGGTGQAFMINLRSDVSVSGPTAWRDETLFERTPDLGFRVSELRAAKEEAGDGFPEKQSEAWTFVRDAIDRGLPCYGWQVRPHIPDYQVITGYDETGYYHSAFAAYDGGPTPWQSLGTDDPAVLRVLYIERTDPSSPEAVVREGLLAAVRHAARPEAVAFPDYFTGPGAFEQWATALDRGTAGRGSHAYNLDVWSECRVQAVAFLEEAKRRLPGRCDDLFDQAISTYAVARDRLLETKAVLSSPESIDWKNDKQLLSAKAAAMLRDAGRAENQGIVILAQIAERLGARGAVVMVAEIETGGQPDGSLDTHSVEPGEILLEDAVAAFQDISENVASHSGSIMTRGATEDVYPQPYCTLTTHLVMMRTAGWDTDFNTLAAVSGASSMFGYRTGDFMPKYAYLHLNPERRIAEATGFGSEWVEYNGPDGAWEIVKESVGSGRPVRGWHGEMMLVAGYDDADRKEDRRVFAMKEGNGSFAEWWTWDQFAEWTEKGGNLCRHSERVTPLSEDISAKRVIQDLVTHSESVPEDIAKRFEDAAFGLSGIEAWARDCGDVEQFPDWSMCHPENPQWTVRNASAAYLDHVAREVDLPPNARPHVAAASHAYRSAYEAWQAAYGQVGYAAPDGSGKDPIRRATASNAVLEALDHECTAIAELRQALAAM